MRILLLIGAFLCSTIAYSQGISLFNIDASNFPTIKAKFYAYDKDGKPIRPAMNEVKLKEDGENRSILKINCPPSGPRPISVGIMVDTYGYLDLARSGAKRLIEYMNMPKDELAITYMDHAALLHQSFTNDRSKAIAASSTIPKAPGYAAVQQMFFSEITGGVQLIKNRLNNKKVLILLSDLHCPNLSVDTARLFREAAQHNICIYPVLLRTTDYTGLFKSIAQKTGGALFEGITREDQISNIFQLISGMARFGDCEIEWSSNKKCNADQWRIQIESKSLVDVETYTPNPRSLIKLTAEPKFLFFGPVYPGQESKKTISLKAEGTTFTINDSKILGSSVYQIVDTKFPIIIPEGQSKTITVKYSPKDSNRHYGFVETINDLCSGGFSAYGGFPGKPLVGKTLNIKKPSCPDLFLAGIDSMIQWEGIPQDDRVKIEYSPDSGKSWLYVTDNAKGGKYVWQYPPLPKTTGGMIRILQLASEGIDPNLWSSGYEPESLSSKNSPDGSKIAYLLNDNSLSIRMAQNGEQFRIFRKIPGRITSYSWDYSGNFLAMGFEDGLLMIKDIRSGNTIKEIKNSSASINVISWNQLGNKIATSSSDGVLSVFETLTGIEIQNKSGYNFIVKNIEWTADGSVTASGACTDEVVLKMSDGFPLQVDTTDCVFSMKAPKLVMKKTKANLGRVIVGSGKDIMIDGVLCNEGDAPLHVLGADVTNGNAEEFGVPRGAGDFYLQPKECRAFMFSLMPQYPGKKKGFVTIRTTVGDFYDVIELTGEGIPPFVSYNEMIDFGQVELTKSKESTVVLLKNIGSEVVDFDSIAQGGPNVKDFFMTEKIKKFSLAPGESKTVTLRFNPKELGLTNGRVMAYYKGVGSPAIVQLYGEGIPRVLPIQNVTVNAFDTITIERRGIAADMYVLGKEKTVHIMDTLTDKILSIDSLFRTDTLMKPLIVITGSIQAVGVDGNNQLVPEAIFKIDLNTSNKYVALLPYVFFEEGSSDIPNRYNKINASNTGGFNINDLYFKNNTIEVYHDIMNIIGKRMTMYPKAVLTISGRNSGIGIEKDNKELSRTRAENVKVYLRDVWGISEKRLRVDIGNLPKSKSLPLDDAEPAQENRRVEFSSNDPRVTEPLDLKNTVATSNPPKVRFNLEGAADFGIASYSVQAKQSGKDGKTFEATGSSSLPTSIEWDIASKQEITPKLAKPMTCTFTITDNKGNSKVVGSDEMNIDVITVERKIKEHIDGYEIDNFSLILFDFNKSELDDDNKRIISAIQKRIKKNSEIEIVGTTDRIGTDEYNNRLSEERAISVKTAINRKRTKAIGKGKQELPFDNDLPEGRFYCRTVNVTVSTPTK
jgi:outer membrane protein OmpA-like peptidoglycan-associated protein/WD40 repeat protein